jgi:hypothetical protein
VACTLTAARLAAFTATLRLIDEPFLGEEILLSLGENELVAAIFTG